MAENKYDLWNLKSDFINMMLHDTVTQHPFSDFGVECWESKAAMTALRKAIENYTYQKIDGIHTNPEIFKWTKVKATKELLNALQKTYRESADFRDVVTNCIVEAIEINDIP